MGSLIAACRLLLWHVGSSFPTRDHTRAPLHWEYGVLATGTPGKPQGISIEDFLVGNTSAEGEARHWAICWTTTPRDLHSSLAGWGRSHFTHGGPRVSDLNELVYGHISKW